MVSLSGIDCSFLVCRSYCIPAIAIGDASVNLDSQLSIKARAMAEEGEKKQIKCPFCATIYAIRRQIGRETIEQME